MAQKPGPQSGQEVACPYDHRLLDHLSETRKRLEDVGKALEATVGRMMGGEPPAESKPVEAPPAGTLRCMWYELDAMNRILDGIHDDFDRLSA